MRHFVQNNLTVEQIIFHANSNNQTELVPREKIEAKLRNAKNHNGAKVDLKSYMNFYDPAISRHIVIL